MVLYCYKAFENLNNIITELIKNVDPDLNDPIYSHVSVISNYVIYHREKCINDQNYEMRKDYT